MIKHEVKKMPHEVRRKKTAESGNDTFAFRNFATNKTKISNKQFIPVAFSMHFVHCKQKIQDDFMYEEFQDVLKKKMQSIANVFCLCA